MDKVAGWVRLIGLDLEENTSVEAPALFGRGLALCAEDSPLQADEQQLEEVGYTHHTDTRWDKDTDTLWDKDTDTQWDKDTETQWDGDTYFQWDKEMELEEENYEFWEKNKT